MIVQSCRISQSYVSRLFRTLFDVTVTDYIHLRKLLLSKRMMLTENCTAADAAYRLGYQESTYFSHVFKKYEGMTIQEFQRRIRGKQSMDSSLSEKTFSSF